MTKAVYPGSFDPITFGHLDIIQRSSKMFDEVVIGVLDNMRKTPLFLAKERVNMINEVVKDIPNVSVCAFSGLLVDFAKSQDSKVIIRGLRAITDFEYELQMAQTNRQIMEDLDTVFLSTNVEYSYLSSSMVKELALFHGDISKFVPKHVLNLMNDKYS